MSEWKEYKLGEIVDVAQGLAINAKTKHLLSDSGLPLLRITDLIHNTQVQFVKRDLAPKQTIALEEDIIYTRTGQVGLVFKGKIGIIHNNCFKVIPKDNKVARNYIYWFLRQPVIKEIANSIASGSVQKDLNHSAFKSISINVPEIGIQNSIAEILSSLDDKIELNNKINQKLESLAQLLFKRWFVDFEFPNENGKPYKSSGGEIVDSELGQIPKGWEVRDLGSISRLSAGGDKPLVVSEEQNETCKVPIFSNGITNYGLYGYTNVAKIFEESVTVSARGTIGFVCLRTQPYFPIVRLISIIPTDVRISSKYLYMWLRNSNISGTGTTQQQLTVPDFTSFKVLVPDESTNKNYTSTLNNLFDTMQTNNDESKNLSKLRDILIPLLISGEIKINDN
jgi:type I restriction enzyme S subunit